MACSCQGSLQECITAYVNPCDEGIGTPFTANVTGNYRILIESFGVATSYTILVQEGEGITLLNNINNNAVHQLQIFEPSGQLLNDTCYSLRTIITLDSTGSPTPSPTVRTMDCSITVIIVDNPDNDVLFTLCNGDEVRYEYAAGNLLKISTPDGMPFLAGLYIQQPVFLDNTVIQDMPYNSTNGTFDNSANGGFNPSGDPNNPTKFTVNYAQPI